MFSHKIQLRCRHTPPYLYPHPYKVPDRNPHPHPHPHSYLCPAFALFSSRKCRCRSRRMSGKCRQQLRSVGDNNWNSSPGFPGPFPQDPPVHRYSDWLLQRGWPRPTDRHIFHLSRPVSSSRCRAISGFISS